MPVISCLLHTRSVKIVLQVGLVAALSAGCSKPKAKAHKPAEDVASADSATSTATTASAAIPNISSARPYAHVPVARESIPQPPLTPPPEASVAPGGVRFQVLKAGTGENPGPTDTMVVDYSMWTGDGQLAMSSYLEQTATAFNVSNIGLQFRMLLTALRQGSKVRYWIPRAALAGWKPANWPDADLIIEFEMLSVSHTKFRDAYGNSMDPVPSLPLDAAGPPADAPATPSGLHYVFLAHGAGSKHPGNTDRIDLTLDAYGIDGLTVSPLEHGLKSATTLERAPGNLGEILAILTPGDEVRVWLPTAVAHEVIPKAGSRAVVLDMTVHF